MKEQDKRMDKLWIIFFLGIIIGCVGINLLARGNKDILEQLNIYLDQFPDGMKEKDILYIVNKRLKQLLFILVLYVAISKKMIVRIITFLFAAILGMYLSVMMMRLGMYGGIYTLMLYFPHFLCYGVAIKLLYLCADAEKVKKRKMVWGLVVLFWLFGIALEQFFFPLWLNHVNI
ncbi:MAG: hypothetical protein IJA10_07815 [Lachnospiraceae bacterium]|nr:hypothetical protein [Lachnospiraceae bacterium]